MRYLQTAAELGVSKALKGTMKMRNIFIVLIINLLWLSQVKAEELADPCSETGAGGLGKCAELRLKAADEELNKNYKALLEMLPESKNDHYPKDALREGQRAWIKYRDQICEFEGEMTGGTRAWKSTNTTFCLAEITKAQAWLLKKYMYCMNDGGENCYNYHIYQ
jgi:uncharacterized protein YecT (DUF1311 family)